MKMKFMKGIFKYSLITVLFWNVQIELAAQSSMDVQQIVDKTNQVYKYLGDDRITFAHMDLRDRDGKTIMERELLVIRKNVKGSMKQKWYAYFKRPADIRKMVFMVWKNPTKDDSRWLYLPAMDLVKRLAGSDKRSSFAGSQFVYEDVTGRNPNLDKHELVKSDGKYYEVKSTPIKTSGVEFSYYYTYVDKKNFVPMKRVFFDDKGDKQRVFKAEKVEVIQGFPTISQFSMTDARTGESTYTTYKDIKYNIGVEDNLFMESQLRRTPRIYLQYNKS